MSSEESGKFWSNSVHLFVGVHVVDTFSDPAIAMWMTVNKLERVGALINQTYEMHNLTALFTAGPDNVTLRIKEVQ